MGSLIDKNFTNKPKFLLFYLFLICNFAIANESTLPAQTPLQNQRSKTISEVAKAVHTLLIQSSSVPPSWALDVGGSLLVPYSRDYEFRSDTGIGLEIGVQKTLFTPYLLLSQSLAHDLYISGHTRLMIGHSFEVPWVRISAMLGMKYKILESKRFDNYIDENEVLPNSYITYGVELLLPLIRNGLFLRIEHWDAEKRMILSQIGAKLYF